MTKRKVDPELVTGALELRQTSKGRRIKLTKAEREAFIRQQRAEAAAALFLDLDEGRKWADIAEELQLSPHQLRDLTKTEEFDEAYNRLFAELGHDPRYKAAQGALADMLPLAVSKLKDLLIGERVAAGTKLRAIEKIISLNGLENMQPAQSDRQELVAFLVENNINLEEMRIVLPSDYAEVEEEVVEATYTDTNQLSSHTQGSANEYQSHSQEDHETAPLSEEDSSPSPSMPQSETDDAPIPLEELALHRDIEEQVAG